MKRLCNKLVFAILFLFLLPTGVRAAELLIPGGQIIGLQLQNGSVTVAAFDDILGSTARNAGLKIGDEIQAVNGQAVVCAEDIRTALTQNDTQITLTIQRDDKKHTLTVTPRQTDEGPRLGIHLKQGITGIGTVTWYDPDSGIFAALGHGVNNSDGKLLKMTKGTAYHGEVMSVKKGQCGEPGLLKGCAEPLGICGSLLRNTPQGVFGITNKGWQGQLIPTAAFEEITTGPASIRSTVEGSTVQEYSVEILKIYPQDRQNGRNFLLQVTDQELLSKTGGIVQGMSGSPIIQNGKLVGAVTHVLVNDPTRGYGIFIGNMLEAAG